MTEKAQPTKPHGLAAWNDRLRALRNIPPLLHMVWEAGPSVVFWGATARVASGLIPLAGLVVMRAIIDDIENLLNHKSALPPFFWWLVVLAFALAAIGTLFSRVMEHASQLDLARYEDPEFYDKLERARVQATDRLATIQMMGQLLEQFITTVTLAGSILFFSPWLLLILIVSVIPALLGESHYAFLNYSLNFRQATTRRQLDYLRLLGASKESA